jgi:hypothetical protein
MLPLMIFGLCSLVGSLATFWLPETADRALPQEGSFRSHFILYRSISQLNPWKSGYFSFFL